MARIRCIEVVFAQNLPNRFRALKHLAVDPPIVGERAKSSASCRFTKEYPNRVKLQETVEQVKVGTPTTVRAIGGPVRGRRVQPFEIGDRGIRCVLSASPRE